MKLRGGLVDAATAQNAIAYVTLAQSLVGHAFTKETMDMYEFKDEISEPTIALSKFNFALQAAHAINLLMPEYGITALAIAVFVSTGDMSKGLKAPRAPMVAWAVLMLGLQHFKASVPDWLLPGILIASGLHGAFFTDQAMDMYKIGTVGVGPKDKPMVLSAQTKSMATFVNAGFVAIGAFLLAPTLGYSGAQAFGAYALVTTAFILKMVLLDGAGDIFNPMGAFVWAVLFGGAGVSAIMA
jgi:hypothetical protein